MLFEALLFVLIEWAAYFFRIFGQSSRCCTTCLIYGSPLYMVMKPVPPGLVLLETKPFFVGLLVFMC